MMRTTEAISDTIIAIALLAVSRGLIDVFVLTPDGWQRWRTLRSVVVGLAVEL
jgi:hypothetical protein